VANALAGLQVRERQRLAEMQQVAVELAVAIAARLAHVKIHAGDFGVEELVREVIEQLDRQQAATLFLHPADMALLERRMESNDSLLSANDHIRLGEDATLPRGDCRAEFGAVSVWSQWQSQLPEIREHLLRSIQDAGARPHQAQT
jgi:flagellar biosynthesis/type III secretory pathway protein FliH